MTLKVAQCLQSIQWLHQYTPSPPSFRAPVWRTLKPNIKREICQLLYYSYCWFLAASQPFHDPKRAHPSFQSDATPFWRLTILLQALLLHLFRNSSERRHPSTTIGRRCNFFVKGTFNGSTKKQGKSNFLPPTKATKTQLSP
jgi:hypothetical protein